MMRGVQCWVMEGGGVTGAGPAGVVCAAHGVPSPLYVELAWLG